MICNMQRPIFFASVHIRQSPLHILSRKEGYIPDPQRLKNVSLEVLIERQASNAFDEDTGPVDVYSIIKFCAWLVD
jgi:hypothetical protein